MAQVIIQISMDELSYGLAFAFSKGDNTHSFLERLKAMKPNAGLVDRILRIFVGTLVLSLAFIGPQSPWGYLGLIPLVTGAIGFCPLYPLFGIRTCPLSKQKPSTK